MSTRAAASALLHHLGRRVFFGPAVPSAAAPGPLLALPGWGCGQGVSLARQLSISASEAKADLAEVYASKAGAHLSSAAVKAEVAIVVAASEAKADVAELYASTTAAKAAGAEGHASSKENLANAAAMKDSK